MPRPARARPPATSRQLQADAYGGGVLARGARRTRSCSGSTAPRGESRDELKAYLTRLEEAAKRDHRKLGTELDLFSFPDEIGSGLAVFHPKGGVLRKVMEDYSRQRHVEDGYEFVNTPHITKARAVRDLRPPGLVRRRHVPADAPGRGARRGRADPQAGPGLLPEADELPDAQPDLRAPAAGRTGSCRCGCSSSARSTGYEKSGVVHGLTRARGFTQDDAHIYCTREQMRDELRNAAARSCSACSPTTAWTTSTSSCPPRTRTSSSAPTRSGRRRPRRSARLPRRSGLELVPDPGGAAFYGPKISVQAKDAIGRTWQMSTIQLDFNLPERFELEYTGAGRLPAAAGDDPPRAVRLDRAVLRRADRALRRRVPALAGAGAGGRHPDRRRPRGLPVRGRRAAAGGRGSGSRSTPPTTGCRRRSATRRSPRCRTC